VIHKSKPGIKVLQAYYSYTVELSLDVEENDSSVMRMWRRMLMDSV
jgi:hypothetical protein